MESPGSPSALFGALMEGLPFTMLDHPSLGVQVQKRVEHRAMRDEREQPSAVVKAKANEPIERMEEGLPGMMRWSSRVKSTDRKMIRGRVIGKEGHQRGQSRIAAQKALPTPTWH